MTTGELIEASASLDAWKPRQPCVGIRREPRLAREAVQAPGRAAQSRAP